MLALINIAFLLMVFFLLAGTLSRPERYLVRPPKSQAQAPLEAPRQMPLVTADGRYGWSRDELTLDQFVDRAARWQAAHPGEILQLKADARSDAVQIIGLLETLRAAGVERVNVVTVPRAQR